MPVIGSGVGNYVLSTANFKGAEKPNGGPWISKICLLEANPRGLVGGGQDPSKTPIGPFYKPKNKNSKSAIENT